MTCRKWLSRRKRPDNSERAERVDRAARQADRQLARVHEVAHETTKVVAVLEETARRNHFGEALSIAFKSKQK